MQITLYKNCKLNDNYDNVFALAKVSGNTNYIIDNYLNTLYSATINVQYSYTDKAGTIVFDSYQSGIGNIYEYNYMKIINTFADGGSIIRYCFIDSISIQNELCYLDYSEDIWHSYGNSMKLTYGYLSRNRLADYFGMTLRKIPINYDGNNGLEVNSILSDERYMLLATMQVYKPATAGNIQERMCNTVILGYSNDTSGSRVYKELFDLDEAIEVAGKFVTWQSAQKFAYDSNDNRYYQIDNIAIIPESFGLYDLFVTETRHWLGNMGGLIVLDNHSLSSAEQFGRAQFIDTVTKPFVIASFSIENNYKRISIGTFSNQIPVINNGKQINCELLYCNGDYGYSLFFNANNTLVEITDDFQLDVPFRALTGEENSQLKMSKAMQGIGGVLKTASNIASIASAGVGIASANAGMKALKYTKTGKLRKLSPKQVSQMAGMKSTKAQRVSDVVSGGSDSILGITQLAEAVYPNYSTTQGSMNIKNGIANYYYGICSFDIIADNTSYVDNAIKNTGYEVYEYLTDFNKTGITGTNGIIPTGLVSMKFNSVRFDYINIYGNFPTDIRETLESILKNGTKILFDYRFYVQ